MNFIKLLVVASASLLIDTLALTAGFTHASDDATQTNTSSLKKGCASKFDSRCKMNNLANVVDKFLAFMEKHNAGSPNSENKCDNITFSPKGNKSTQNK